MLYFGYHNCIKTVKEVQGTVAHSLRSQCARLSIDKQSCKPALIFGPKVSCAYSDFARSSVIKSESSQIANSLFGRVARSVPRRKLSSLAMGCASSVLANSGNSYSSNSGEEPIDISSYGYGTVLPATDESVARAVAAVSSGEVITLPTDTLYGLACQAENSEAIKKVYAIKRRNRDVPIAICVASVDEISNYCDTSSIPPGLLGALLPGPVTVLLKKLDESRLSDLLNPGTPNIGVRVPDSGFIRRVVTGLEGQALALTSANISKEQSTVAVQEFEALWGHCKFVFDGGALQAGRQGSTIVDLSFPHQFRIIREGVAHTSTVSISRKYGLLETTAAK